jgi:hypothetical protein
MADGVAAQADCLPDLVQSFESGTFGTKRSVLRTGFVADSADHSGDVFEHFESFLILL